MTLTEFRDLLLTVTPNAFHYEAHKATPPYLVWEEYRSIRDYADNKPRGGFWRVQVDYYTQKEFDPGAVKLENTIAGNEIPFRHTVTYERDLKLIRHIFDCEVVLDG